MSKVDETTIRAYSMANYPEEKGLVKFNIRVASPASGARVAHAASHSSGLQMLLHDRAHYLIDYADPMRGLLENLPDNSITSDLLVQIPVYLFVSRAFPDSQALLQRLDAAFSALEQRGEVQRILATTAYSP